MANQFLGDIDLAAAALASMRQAGGTADRLSGDLTFLGETVACHAPLAIIQLLLNNRANPDGFSRDARDELAKSPEYTWRRYVEGLFVNAPPMALRKTVLSPRSPMRPLLPLTIVARDHVRWLARRFTGLALGIKMPDSARGAGTKRTAPQVFDVAPEP